MPEKPPCRLDSQHHNDIERLQASKKRKRTQEALQSSTSNPSTTPAVAPKETSVISQKNARSTNFGNHTSAPLKTHSSQDALKRKAEALWQVRKTLPVWSHSRTIRQSLREHDVLIIAGETGSGKSTQIPQILLSESWCKHVIVPAGVDGQNGEIKQDKVGGCIAITQPRRIAAITLARRVAAELGTPLGTSSKSSQVGYSVRFDHNVGPSTRIKFLTEGMLLQEMLRDPWLKEYSAVVVDEVHERGVNVDLILGFLRGLVRRSRDVNDAEKRHGSAQGGELKGNTDDNGRHGNCLKVIIMSATAEVEKIRDFFSSDLTQSTEEPILPKPALTANGLSASNGDSLKRQTSTSAGNEYETNGSASDEEWNGLDSDNDGKQAVSSQTHNSSGHRSSNEPEKKLGTQNNGNTGTSTRHDRPLVNTCFIKGRQHPVKTIYTPEPVPDWVNTALDIIFQIHFKEPLPGDILVFLTGQETVESLEGLVKELALSMDQSLPQLLILPLFAALPQDSQNKVFDHTPASTRKVILATNIAETSVTVPGVRYVIDCGKAKVKQYRSKIGMESLLVKSISKSAAIQRQGRAGREAPGQCYRLYTEQDYLSLEHSNTPEILRCDLSQAILTMKARGVQDVTSFPLLDPPLREGMEKALMQLFQLGAVSETGEINDMGRQMSQLPLSCPLARTLLAASQMHCVAEVIDIISCLSVENIFLNPKSEEKKEEADNARRTLYRREGDHLTLLATVQAYASEHSDRKTWADRHYVSHRAMRSVMVRVFHPPTLLHTFA